MRRLVGATSDFPSGAVLGKLVVKLDSPGGGAVVVVVDDRRQVELVEMRRGGWKGVPDGGDAAIGLEVVHVPERALHQLAAANGRENLATGRRERGVLLVLVVLEQILSGVGARRVVQLLDGPDAAPVPRAVVLARVALLQLQVVVEEQPVVLHVQVHLGERHTARMSTY